jgi:hypothetical protein
MFSQIENIKIAWLHELYNMDPARPTSRLVTRPVARPAWTTVVWHDLGTTAARFSQRKAWAAVLPAQWLDPNFIAPTSDSLSLSPFLYLPPWSGMEECSGPRELTMGRKKIERWRRRSWSGSVRWRCGAGFSDGVVAVRSREVRKHLEQAA